MTVLHALWKYSVIYFFQKCNIFVHIIYFDAKKSLDVNRVIINYVLCTISLLYSFSMSLFFLIFMIYNLILLSVRILLSSDFI